MISSLQVEGGTEVTFRSMAHVTEIGQMVKVGYSENMVKRGFAENPFLNADTDDEEPNLSTVFSDNDIMVPADLFKSKYFLMAKITESKSRLVAE